MQLRTLAVSALSLAAAGLMASTAAAQAGITKETLVTGLNRPLWAGTPPGDTRIFVVEQHTNDIELFDADGTFIGKFLDLSGMGPHGSGSERGLLALAFHPDYQTNGFFYVYYTTGVNSRIERFSVSANPNVADATSGVTIIEQSQPFSNHNGGGLNFGPDGFLYFSYGDGGSGGDPGCRAQDPTTLLGKMIRIDVDNDDFPADPLRNYAIPAGNPFAGGGGLPEIFHVGLRNPWRWSFDSATGDMWIGDVGQTAREEVSMALAGESNVNFGWKIMEGFNCFSTASCTSPPPCNDPSLRLPVFDWNWTGGASSVGGVVYNGCAMPDMVGDYFFGDYGPGRIWILPDGTTPAVEITAGIGTGLNNIVHFGEDGDGEILMVNLNNSNGTVYRIIPSTDVSGDVEAISVGAGGTQNITINPGADRAGDLYFLAGSLTGTGPTPYGSLLVPLTADIYTDFSITQPNTPPLTGNFGTLDACGNATASFSLGAGQFPGLAGTSAWHAYVVFTGLTADYASATAAQVNFLP